MQIRKHHQKNINVIFSSFAESLPLCSVVWHHLWEGLTDSSSYQGVEDSREYSNATNTCWVLTCLKRRRRNYKGTINWLTGLFITVALTVMVMMIRGTMMMKQKQSVISLTRHISFIVNGVSPSPPYHNRNGSTVHQLLSAFVPLTPQRWQHWVCSFKWAFAHSLRITTTASVLAGVA